MLEEEKATLSIASDGGAIVNCSLSNTETVCKKPEPIEIGIFIETFKLRLAVPLIECLVLITESHRDRPDNSSQCNIVSLRLKLISVLVRYFNITLKYCKKCFQVLNAAECNYFRPLEPC